MPLYKFLILFNKNYVVTDIVYFFIWTIQSFQIIFLCEYFEFSLLFPNSFELLCH